MTRTLLIDARYLLDYDRASADAYASVSVNPKHVQRAPYHHWMLRSEKLDIEEASALQTVRDARLVERLFAKNGARELPLLDAVYAAIELQVRVVVLSHETPDALAAIVARCGLSQRIEQRALVDYDALSELIRNELDADGFNLTLLDSDPDWLERIGVTPSYLLYTEGLTLGRVRGIDALRSAVRLVGNEEQLLLAITE